jgi:hypothetical protein
LNPSTGVHKYIKSSILRINLYNQGVLRDLRRKISKACANCRNSGCIFFRYEEIAGGRDVVGLFIQDAQICRSACRENMFFVSR